MGQRSIPPVVAAALDRFTRSVRERFGDRVSEIVLFGSYARGEANEESDVDVLVSIDGLSERELSEVLDLATAVKQTTDPWVGLSPLVLSTEQAREMRARGRLLWRDIAAQGVAL
jgi:predicted nucleotidyltransferase